MGVVSPLGHEPDTLYDNLLAGRSGVTEIAGFDASDYSTRFAGEVNDLRTEGYIQKKMERRLDKCIKWVDWWRWRLCSACGGGVWGGGLVWSWS